ncbi:MAG TPA: hypothetical protein VIU93_11730 [Gallionellaceae bacterium]
MNWNFVDTMKRRKDKMKSGLSKSGTTTPTEARATQEAIQSRRSALRGVLAVGCSLVAPAVFFSAGANAAAPEATAKLPKKNVQYQTHPNGDKKCSGCVNFIAASSTCKLVEGPIDPEGWCVLWSKKT